VSHTNAPVAVLVCAFNEDADVLEETLSSVLAMDYPAMQVYLVDDSTDAKRRVACEALAQRLGVPFVHRSHRRGFKAGAINELIPRLTEPYIAILDADQRPNVSWLKDMVPLLEGDKSLAFVQVPQIYVNTEGLRVARAAKFQQAIFFEYICEGKARSNAMFCCGSNVIIRRDALLSIERTVKGTRQFFDESSVTEDFATSVRLHARGWHTKYVNKPYVFGTGPETLAAYFTQQMRWATGTLGVGVRLILRLFINPTMLRPAQWWEYLLSGTYYFVGFAHFVFMLAPLLWMAFDVRPLRAHAELYLLIFVPYMLFNLNVVFYGMRLRGYPVKGIRLAMTLSFCTFWTYIKAARYPDCDERLA
jgi:cellulose synthase (UDP-forming)